MSTSHLVLLLACLVLSAGAARAHSVEPDSQDNRLYVLVWQSGPELSVLGIDLHLPACCSGASAVHVPSVVPENSGRLAVFEFDVDPATLGFTGDASVTVSGYVDGSPIQEILT